MEDNVHKIARQIIAELWEHGCVNKSLLEKDGCDYKEVIECVNKMLKVKGIDR